MELLIGLFVAGLIVVFLCGWWANDWMFGPKRKYFEDSMAQILLQQQQGQERAMRRQKGG